MINAYEAGAIEAADLVGCAGKVKIDIEPASGDYAAKNTVKDYGSKAAKKADKDAAKPSFIKQAEEDIEDDGTIPY
jgi:hypothetical protein